LPILYKDAALIATGPPALPFPVRTGSATKLRQRIGRAPPADQRAPAAGGGEAESSEDEGTAAGGILPGGGGTSTSPGLGGWPHLSTTLAMARQGKFSTKQYQRSIQNALRNWIKDTTDEFEMRRLDLQQQWCPTGSHGSANNQCASGAGGGPSGTGRRGCNGFYQRATRWLGCEEDTGTRSPAYVPLSQLIHPSILCDSCYECIEGTWYRCCSCRESFDLCSKCEGKVEHDPRHVFALFKQPVDMALFKSLIDHNTEANGHALPARPMLPVLLVGGD